MNPNIDKSTVLTEQEIPDLCEPIFRKFKVKYCYLFGDYAKGTADRMSEVKLMVDCQMTEPSYLRMEKTLQTTLRKRIVLVTYAELSEHAELKSAVAQCCRKIYG